MQVETLKLDRLASAKTAYATRNIDLADAATLVTEGVRPLSGDLVLATVTELGHHRCLELRDGRRSTLFAGDEILVVYGDRYAPEQFEAEIGDDLRECDLVAAGGLAAHVLSRFDKARRPTRIRPIGIVGDGRGEPLNLRRYALPPIIHPKTASVVAVLGASMNAGKTTTAVSLIRGLAASGHRVGAAKVTGTGAGGDYWLMKDAGAEIVLDFTAAGVVSTYKIDERELLCVFSTVVGHAMKSGIDFLVLEVADGVYQRETAMLARADEFRDAVDGVMFACRDALGATAGVRWLEDHHLNVRGLSGTITQSPLAVREAAEATGLPVLTPGELSDADTVQALLGPNVGRSGEWAPVPAAPVGIRQVA